MRLSHLSWSKKATLGITTLVGSLLLCTAASAEPPSVAVQTISNGILHGTSLSLPAQNSDFIMQTEKGTVRTALLDVVSVEFASQSANASDSPTPHEVVLVSGERIRGLITGGDEAGISLHTLSLGATDISIDLISQVIFHGNFRPREAASFPLKDGTDTAYRRTAVGRDVITGVLLEFDDGGCVFDSSIGEYRLQYRDLLGISLLPQVEVKATTQLLTIVDAIDGSHFEGFLTQVSADAILLTSRLDEKRVIHRESVKSISFKNGKFVYLSELTPTAVTQTPFIGDPEEFLFPYQMDRSVGGKPLTIQGHTYARGIGVHSRCRLTFALNGEYKTFQTIIGIDDEALALRKPGVVKFQILVDGKEIHSTGLVRAGMEPQMVGPLSVAGAKELTLFVDFGDNKHFGDRADWASAMLIR